MKLEETLRVLYDAGVEFVVIGGAAMSLQGSAHVTRDIDFCYSCSQRNIARLASALKPYKPRLREAPEDLPFRFDAETIARGQNFTLATDLGEIDFFAEVAGLGAFEEVKAASDLLMIDGVSYHVLSLSGIIRAKRAAGRPRDLYVLPELEALQELREKLGQKD